MQLHGASMFGELRKAGFSFNFCVKYILLFSCSSFYIVNSGLNVAGFQKCIYLLGPEMSIYVGYLLPSGVNTPSIIHSDYFDKHKQFEWIGLIKHCSKHFVSKQNMLRQDGAFRIWIQERHDVFFFRCPQADSGPHIPSYFTWHGGILHRREIVWYTKSVRSTSLVKYSWSWTSTAPNAVTALSFLTHIDECNFQLYFIVML